ncbi:MAG: MgtC/SapB family protein [Tannerella sp.]|jgi:putative Mg2+ transporter-C (MgtC) family protein|nr:MgtC/SapB family protein [Tannerella sp.]
MDLYTALKETILSTDINVYTALVRLLASFLLGAIIGVERQIRRREAGLRTFTLICLGSTLAMLLSIWIPQTYPDFLNGDPGRIAAQVLTGVGFLGAGAIIQSHGSVYGLTTAACIWVVAVIGLAVGAGMYIEAIVVTVLTIMVLVSLELLEKKMMLSGVNKILTIVCSTSSPDLKKIYETIESFNIYIVTSSYDYNYDKNTAVLIYKVNVNSKSSYLRLFEGIRMLGNISEIKILT